MERNLRANARPILDYQRELWRENRFSLISSSHSFSNATVLHLEMARLGPFAGAFFPRLCIIKSKPFSLNTSENRSLTKTKSLKFLLIPDGEGLKKLSSFPELTKVIMKFDNVYRSDLPSSSARLTPYTTCLTARVPVPLAWTATIQFHLSDHLWTSAICLTVRDPISVIWPITGPLYLPNRLRSYFICPITYRSIPLVRLPADFIILIRTVSPLIDLFYLLSLFAGLHRCSICLTGYELALLVRRSIIPFHLSDRLTRRVWPSIDLFYLTPSVNNIVTSSAVRELLAQLINDPDCLNYSTIVWKSEFSRCQARKGEETKGRKVICIMNRSLPTIRL